MCKLGQVLNDKLLHLYKNFRHSAPTEDGDSDPTFSNATELPSLADSRLLSLASDIDPVERIKDEFQLGFFSTHKF